MPTFASDTVHGLSADVYFNSIARRTFGDVVWSTELNTLDLTANDLGAVEPVQVLRRGDVTRVTVPLSDTTGIATLSGVVLPFASGVSAGPASGGLVLPVAVPGDDYLSKAQELRLVARDGSFTLIAPSAAVVEIEDLALSEENQNVYGVTFQLFRATISGQSTPYLLISGSHATGIL
jgi:hypothetical protein